MKVDTMRAIDRWVGVPLCAVADVCARLGSLFRKTPTRAPDRVLLIELSEMGSAILADPAMRLLRERGEVELFFVIFRDNAPSLDLLGTVPRENVFEMRSDNLHVLAIDVIRFLRWCRRRRIDAVIDLELFSRFTALLSWLSGAQRRVGFATWHDEGLYRGNLLTHLVRYSPHHHIARNFVMLAETLLADRRGDPYCRFALPEDSTALASAPRDEDAIERVRAKIHALYADYRAAAHRLVLVNPNGGELLPQRRWMPDRFVTVIEELIERYADVLVLVTGASAERASCAAIVDRVSDSRCLNAAGVFELRELVSLYHAAELMLTNDSGPAHFAAVTPLPTYVLFGPETPELYGSLGNSTPIYAGLACSPCVSAANHRKTSCTDNVCLAAITPAQVLALLHAELGGDRRGSAARARTLRQSA